MKRNISALAGMLLLSLGCLGCHPAALIIPSYIQSVGVQNVENRTSQYGLDTQLTQAIIREFQVDGRVPIADPDKADMVVKVVIRQYVENPIFYDPKTNFVLQYQVSLVYDVAAVDQQEKKTFLEDDGKTHSVYYYTPQYTGAIPETKDQSITDLVNDTARAIVRRVLVGY